MDKCDQCGEETMMPYECNRCGKKHCSTHRLPENHNCDGSLIPGDGNITAPNRDPTLGEQIRKNLSTVLESQYVEKNMTFVFLALMWAVFISQGIVSLFSPEIHNKLFVLTTENVEYVWTWITSIFAHGGLFHIIINSIVLFFFGPLVERRIGTKRFTAFFLGAGAIAGLSQVIVMDFFSPVPGGVVGASGAVAGILGLLTVLNPKMRVWLFFTMPLPLWFLTTGFIVYSAWVSITVGIGAGGVAQLAHLMGVVVGFLYGVKAKRDGVAIPDNFRLDPSRNPGKRPPR